MGAEEVRKPVVMDDHEIVIPKKHPNSPWHFMVFNGLFNGL